MQPATDRTKILLLGTVEVRGLASGPDTDSRLQPKRVALLMYLAMAPGPVRRDTLRYLFWPELDDTQARRALNQAAFHLRRALGEDALVSEGMESLGLARDRVSCDAAELEELVAAGELARAVALYRGAFAQGFHVSELPELERWIDATRQRIADKVAAACTTLSVAEAERDPAAALDWARRAFTIDPREAHVRRVITLLDALGDRAGAIRQYEQFARELREELEVDPAPETLRLVADVRARAGHGARRESPASSPGVTAPSGDATRASDPAVSSAVPARSRRRTAAIVAGLWIAGVLGAAAIVVPLVRRPPSVDAGVLTLSTDAREEFRVGDAHLHAGRYDDAVTHLRRAVELDSSFAIAHYKLSVAANWTGQNVLATRSATHAQRLAASLPPRDRSRVDAWLYYLTGLTDQAAPLYEGMLAADSSDVEAWFYLAEIQFHWGPMFGTAAARSVAAWDHVLELDPDNAGALIHRARIAAMNFNEREFEALATRIAKLAPSTDRAVEVRALRAFAFGDSAAQAASVAEIESADVLRKGLIHEIHLSARDLKRTGDLVVPTAFVGQGFGSWEQGFMMFGASIALATGRVDKALAALDSAELLQADRAIEYRGYFAAIPGLPFPDGWTRKVTTALAGPPHASTTHAYSAPLRRYLLATLAVRRGDLPDARRHIAALRAFDPSPEITGDSSLHRHVDRYIRLATAEVRRAEGKSAEALAALGAPTIEPDKRIPYVWSFPRAHERFLRGDLLADLGRLKEADAWFETFPDPGAYDFAYLPAAILRRASIADRLGDHAGAAALRQRAESIWPGSTRVLLTKTAR